MDTDPSEAAKSPGWPVGTQIVQIDPDSASRLEQAEKSIGHWNKRHMDLSLELRGLESTVLSLQQLKSQILDEALKKIGVDSSTFEIAQVRSDGKVLLQLKSSDPGQDDPTPTPDPQDREKAS